MRHGLFVSLLLSTSFAVADSTTEPHTANVPWSQWRGSNRDGKVPGADWPDSLSGLDREWRVPLGKGYPGPIVTKDRVFVVESTAEEDAQVRALTLATGEELWRVSWTSSGSVPFFARRNGDWVRSTPVWDGKTLYVGDMREVLVALDGETGKQRWRVDFPNRFGTSVPDFGFASSPLIDDGHLYVQGANSIVKLDASTGQTVWRTLEHSGKIASSGAFSSPIIAELNGQRQLLVQDRHELHGVALVDGGVLWTQAVPNYRGMNILTPVVFENSVFTSTYKNATFLYSVSRQDDVFSVHEKWKNKAQGYMSTPVVIDGHVYLHLANGRLDCIDLKTGDSRWRSKRLGKYWSMVVQDKHILGLDSGGTLYLVRANPERFELLDSREVANSETWGHLAVVGDRLLIRELEGISAWRWTKPPTGSPAPPTTK